MFKFFRTIRIKLVATNNVNQYLRYAIGEIILVVIGIVLALQLNNWNEKRKLEGEYKAVLEQIYTVIDQDSERLSLIGDQLMEQANIIDSLLINPYHFEKKLIPHLLFYVVTKPPELISESSYLLRYLKFNPNNQKQSNLNKSLSSYGNNINKDFGSNNQNILNFLDESQLPQPPLIFGFSASNNYEDINLNYFNEFEISKAFELLKSDQFQNALKSEKSAIIEHFVFINNSIVLAKTNNILIKSYYPEAKLLYSNIGIIGSATSHKDWVTNIPLTMTDESKTIWEGDIELSEGTVKFREGNNWNFNWGGDEFPKGRTQSYGNNIIVQPGNYHVVINLTEKTYQFILR